MTAPHAYASGPVACWCSSTGKGLDLGRSAKSIHNVGWPLQRSWSCTSAAAEQLGQAARAQHWGSLARHHNDNRRKPLLCGMQYVHTLIGICTEAAA